MTKDNTLKKISNSALSTNNVTAKLSNQICPQWCCNHTYMFCCDIQYQLKYKLSESSVCKTSIWETPKMFLLNLWESVLVKNISSMGHILGPWWRRAIKLLVIPQFKLDIVHVQADTWDDWNVSCITYIYKAGTTSSTRATHSAATNWANQEAP